MPKAKKKEPVREESVEPIVEKVVETPTIEVAVEESEARKSFKAYIEGYKLRNPKKYALKEKGLLEQLNQIK